MKQLLFFTAITLAITASGQTKDNKASSTFLNTIVQQSDTALQVIYVEKNKSNQQPAYFINGRFIKNSSLPSNINPQTIDSLEVLKRDTLIDKVPYSVQVYIKTKEGFVPKFITLNELKNKYTNLQGKPAVIMLDGNFINADYDNYSVDENNLLTIIIDNLQMAQGKIDLGLIKILSKTEENIKARKQIILRGAELTMNK